MWMVISLLLTLFCLMNNCYKLFDMGVEYVTLYFRNTQNVRLEKAIYYCHRGRWLVVIK